MNSPDIFFRVSPKKWKFRLENENFQISRKSCWKFFIISDKDLQDQPGMSLPVLGIMQTTLNMLDIWKSVIGGGRPMNLKAGSITVCIGWIPRKFKIFIFKSKLLFSRWIHEKLLLGWILTNSSYIWQSIIS